MTALANIHEPVLSKYGCLKTNDCDKYNPSGLCYRLNPDIGDGYFWIYSYKNIFSIIIHDFVFYEDFYFEQSLPECFSISYDNSISGEEIDPYRRINAGYVKGQWYSPDKNYRAIFHKMIPIKIIGIELMPEYWEKVLIDKFENENIDPCRVLSCIAKTKDFPEMKLLLHQILNYKGTGISVYLFYEAKVSEAVALIYDRYKNQYDTNQYLSLVDINHLQNAASYIHENYNKEVSLMQLCKITCMGSTKLKTSFKQFFKSTVTEYIQNYRVNRAKDFLSNLNLSVGEISRMIGYKNVSRFSELFKRNTGLLPREYRHLSRHI